MRAARRGGPGVPHHNHLAGQRGGPGEAVQLDPMKPDMKPPGSKRLNLKSEVLLSNFYFKFNLRCYTLVAAGYRAFYAAVLAGAADETTASAAAAAHALDDLELRAARELLALGYNVTGTSVWRCRLTQD